MKTVYRCNGCGFEQGKWFGKCPSCKEFDTAVEVTLDSTRKGKVSSQTFSSATMISLKDVKETKKTRLSSGIHELDRVLGGGIVTGSYMLLAGEPGAGKTTLASEVVIHLDNDNKKVAYFSGEESPEQLKMRFERLGNLSKDPNFMISNEVSVERISKTITEESFDLVVIDSIQTMFSEQIEGAPGSLSQVREAGGALMRAAKSTGTAVLVIGQVIKSGEIAGPRTLEHMVDAVLTFEGDRREQYRILRGVKNRFGSTDEIGVFEMTSEGLLGVSDPSAVFVDQEDQYLSGSALTVLIEGSRPVLVEIQALANSSQAPQPTRAVRGFDQKRAQMLLAVLQRHCSLRVSSYDIYINVSGGLKIDDPGADLAVCLAVASAIEQKTVKEGSVAFGEVSLLGKVRNASQTERRKNEASRLGYTPLAGSGNLSEIIKKYLS
jgi:DNA repair protein RadA/Sms